MQSFTHGEDPGAESRRNAIVMYSPDVDLCMSFTLYFQEKYSIITTTDGNSLPALVETYHPSLVIVDALPTRWILELFDRWKKGSQDISIMLFRVWRYEDRKREATIHQSIDFVVYKPIDIDFVARVINNLHKAPGSESAESRV